MALARCLIARPSLLIMDNALTAFGPVEARQVLANVREAMSGKTLLVTRDDTSDARDFDRVLEFEGPRYIVSRDAGHEPDPPAVRAPDQLGANRQAHAGTG